MLKKYITFGKGKKSDQATFLIVVQKTLPITLLAALNTALRLLQRACGESQGSGSGGAGERKA
jgi:hypothetical protein